jgi:LysR family transcriptional regulator, regulator for genes of the gallate degradation pathway
LRVFAAVVETGSITRAAERALVSQPAVTQAVTKLEKMLGQPLLQRTPQAIFANPAGQALANRINRAFGFLDPALSDLTPRLVLTATAAQLQALIVMREAENFTLAARRMGLAQPTVHRAVSQLELEAGRCLFERTPHGMIATRPAHALAQAARLAFAELAQAEADLAELAGREVGRIVVGAMPLSRSYLLPRAIARFRQHRATLPIKALDGPYDDLMSGLRRGEVDFLIGALRDPPPVGDIVQERLFEDGLLFVARKDHPILTQANVSLKALFAYPIVVATEGTPTRRAFDGLSTRLGPPPSLVETGSMILMRELLRLSDHLGCISRLQIEAEIDLGALVPVPVDLADTRRPIGLTYRADWLPTRAQAEFLDDLKATAGLVNSAPN